MRTSAGNKQTEFPSREFYKKLGVCFNALRATFVEIFRYIHTGRQVYRKFHFIIQKTRKRSEKVLTSINRNSDKKAQFVPKCGE